MATTPINIGSAGNDGTGDKLRDAFNKVNLNFTDVGTSLSSLNTTLTGAITNIATNTSGLSTLSGTVGTLSTTVGTHTTQIAALTSSLAAQPIRGVVRVVTTGPLPAYTYANGSAGVGATITATANGAWYIDGVALALNDLFLVRNELTANQPYHGVYQVTQAGSSSVPLLATRSTLFNAPSQISNAVFLSGPEGTINKNGLFVVSPGTYTIGTTAIQFNQAFSGPSGYQIAATRTGYPNGKRQGTAGSRTDQYMIARRRHTTGPVVYKDFKMAFSSTPTVGGTGEVALGNDVSIQAALEQLTGPAVTLPVYFGQAATGVVPNGIPLVVSEPPCGITTTPTMSLTSRVNISLASSSLYFPANSSVPVAGSLGDGGYISSADSGQTFSSGALTAPSGGASYNGTPPYAIVAKAVTPTPAVIIVGDSIANNNNDVIDANGLIAFIQRGLQNVGGSNVPMPWSAQTVGSHTVGKATIDLSPRHRSLWQYATHIICELGTNDIANGATFSQMQALYTQYWKEMRSTIGPYGKPVQVFQSLIMPRVTGIYRLSTAITPVVTNGGSGYAASSTFTVTVSGGTLASGGSAATLSVTTNASGVVTTINSVTNQGAYSAAPAVPTFSDATRTVTVSTTGGAGSGLTITGAFPSFYSASVQTPLAGFVNGGIRDQVNAWIVSQVGILIDGYIDPNPIVEDQSNHGLWVTNGTEGYATWDGVHMEPIMHNLTAPLVTAAAQTFRV